MRVLTILVMIIHGLLHVLGFVKAFGLAETEQLTKAYSKPAGLLWLLAAVLFMAAAFLYLLQIEWWWMIGSTAIILSQALILLYWRDAKFGTLANLLLIVPVIIALAGSLPTSYQKRFEAEVEKGLRRYPKQQTLTMEDIRHLPLPVQKYIIYSGAIGKDKVHNFRAVFQGQIKPDPKSDFLDFRSVQYNFYDEPARIFYIRSGMFGIPFDGLHTYTGATATMQIKLASLFQVVDAKGPEMNKSETVTLFNDMCVLAPATLIDKNIEWQTVNPLKVKARFTNQGHTITATLFFNEAGELINFSSNDRYESADGKIFRNYQWTTPIKEYSDFNGRRLASFGALIWHKPTGRFCYGKFNLVALSYNCQTFE